MPRCECYDNRLVINPKPVPDGQHKAFCPLATKTQKFIDGLANIERAMIWLDHILPNTPVIGGETKKVYATLEAVRNTALDDWNDDATEANMVFPCDNLNESWAYGCELYTTTHNQTLDYHLCPECIRRHEKDIESYLIQDGWKTGLNHGGQVELTRTENDFQVLINGGGWSLSRFTDGDVDGVARGRFVQIEEGCSIRDLESALKQHGAL